MNDDRLDWVPCYADKWLGALAGMTPDTGYVYFIVCLRIYEANRACTDSLESLATRTRMNRRRVSNALDALFKAGKLVRTPDGIMNPFCDRVLAAAKALRRERKRAGAAGASARWEIPEQNQQLCDATAIGLPLANDSYVQLQLQVEDKYIEPTPERRRRRVEMPEDWQPSDRGILYAKTVGLEPERIEVMIRACRNYHIKHGTMIAGERGLDATWRTWCDNEITWARDRRTRHGNGIAGGAGGGAGGKTRDVAIATGVARAAAKMARHSERERADSEIHEPRHRASDGGGNGHDRASAAVPAEDHYAGERRHPTQG